jgi:hypothetical protein
MAEHDDLWNDLFHGCAIVAYIEQAAEEGRWPPDSEATRRRAYRYYEEELAASKAEKQPAGADVAGLTRTPGRAITEPCDE